MYKHIGYKQDKMLAENLFLCFILFLMMEYETVLRLLKQSFENTTLIMELSCYV